MTDRPGRYCTPDDLPFNSSCLAGRFLLQPPDSDPGGPGLLLALAGNRLLVQETAGVIDLPQDNIIDSLNENSLYVGTWQDRPCRLICLPRDFAAPAGLRLENLLSQEPGLSIELLTVGGLGGMIQHWEDRSRYCSACCRPMHRLAGEWGKHCPTCDSHHFPHIHPCVIVLVQRPGEILLARKPAWAANRYSLVAGFLEFGESLEEAVVREVAEETGVAVTNLRYVGSQCWPFPSQIMAGFIADYAGGDLVVQTSELEDARWFPLDDLPDLPPQRSIARYLLDTVLGLP